MSYRMSAYSGIPTALIVQIQACCKLCHELAYICFSTQCSKTLCTEKSKGSLKHEILQPWQAPESTNKLTECNKYNDAFKRQHCLPLCICFLH